MKFPLLILLITITPLLPADRHFLVKKIASAVPVDYCRKLDTLVNNRYHPKSRFFSYEDRILSEIEKASSIYGTYSLGFGGMTYCDTFFNNDVRRWSKYFSCKEYHLPPAPKVIPPMCDTANFPIEWKQ